MSELTNEIAALLQIAPEVCASLGLQDKLVATCEYATKHFKTTHSALVLFAADGSYGKVFAEYPEEFGTLGQKIEVKGIPAEERLLNDREPLAITDVSTTTDLGPVKSVLLKFGIRSILIVPIIHNGRVCGSFSVDIFRDPRTFSPKEIELGRMLADVIASEIATAEFFSRERLRREQLEALRTNEIDLKALLTTITNNAVSLFKVRSAGLYEYDERSRVLTMVAEYSKAHPFRQIKVGEGIAGRLIESGDSHMIIEDYSTWTGRAPAYHDDPAPFGAVLAVPVKWQKTCRGVFFVDDVPSRKFTDEDARFLELYADQVVAALVEAETRRRLELMLKVSNVVTEADSPDIGLKRAAGLLLSEIDACFCRVLLLESSGEKLIAHAAESREGFVWDPDEAREMVVSEWDGLKESMADGRPRVIRRSQTEQAEALDRFCRLLHISPLLSSALLVPLKSESRPVGLLTLGEQSPGPESHFTRADLDLAQAVGAQLTIPVERLRYTERHRKLLDTLMDISERIRSQSNLATVQTQVVKFALELTGFSFGGLFLGSTADQMLELVAAENLPAQQMGKFKWEDNLLARVAQTGERVTWRFTDGLQLGVPVPAGTELAVLMPLPSVPQKQLILVLGGPSTLEEFVRRDLHILSRFAASAGVAIETARSFQIANLNIELSNYVQTTQDQERILYATLTAVTAEYGLQFNRAALFLRKGDHHFRCDAAIGQTSATAATGAWREAEKQGLRSFPRYIEALERNAVSKTELAEILDAVTIDLRTPQSSKILEASQKLEVVVLGSAELPSEMAHVFSAEGETVLVPMVAYGRVVGVMVADNFLTRTAITSELREGLLTYAKTAAVAIENLRLNKLVKDRAELLRALYKAGNEIIVTGDPEVDLKNLVHQARLAANAIDVRLILMNDAARPQQIITFLGHDLDLERVIRPDGLSIQAFRNQKIIPIQDIDQQRRTLNPYTFNELHGSALCFPLVLREKSLGVMWFLFEQIGEFHEDQIDALKLYVNQAAIICGTSLHLRQRDVLNQAVSSIWDCVDLEATLAAIVDTSQRVFRSDSCTFWFYDSKRKQFLPQHVAAVGIDSNKLRTPREGKLSYRLIAEGYIEEENVHTSRSTDYEFLKEYNIGSFRGIVLKIAHDPVGVLYLGYEKPQVFADDDRKLLESFAPYASLVVSKATMLDHVNREIKAAQRFRSASDSVENVLQEIADATQEGLQCDAVVLYACNPSTGIVPYLPAVAGVKNKAAVVSLQPVGGGQQAHRVRPQSIVYKMLDRDDPYIAKDAATDEYFGGTRFQREEGVKSCMAVPIAAFDEKLGVMFINYTKPHRFTDQEFSIIQRFVDQAGIAIRNAQFREELSKQEAIRDLSRTLLSTPDIQTRFNKAVELAQQRLHTDYAIMVRVEDDGVLKIAAVAPSDQNLIGTVLGPGRESHAGYIIQEKRSVVVPDFGSRHLPFDRTQLSQDFGLTSGMGVPMTGFGREEPIGAMLVHTRIQRGFSQADETFLQLIADLTASSIRDPGNYALLEEFMRTASHELSTPLAQVSLYIENLINQLYGKVTKRQSKVLGGILDAVMDGMHLIDNMLNLVRIQDGRIPVKLRLAALVPIIRSAVELFYLDAKKKSIRIDFQFPRGDRLEAMLDEHLTRSILRNLISNAVKFTDAGSITIKAFRDGAFAWVKIQDTGVGIAEADRSRIFDRFMRMPNRGGLGVGLSIVREFVKTQDGKLEIESELGSGSTFSFGLPAANT